MDTRFLYLLGLVSLVAGKSSTACNLCLNEVCHEKTRLLRNDTVSNTNNFVIDRPGKILYYTDHDNAVYSLNLEDGTLKQITPDSSKNRALAVDQKTRDLYIGNDHGILKYNPVTNKKDRISFNVGVINLQFKDKLYVIGATDGKSMKRLYKLEESGLVWIEALDTDYVSKFVVDKRGDIYFSKLYDMNLKLPVGGDRVTNAYDRERFYYVTDKSDEVFFVSTKYKYVLKLDYSLGQFVKVGAGDSTVFDYFFSTILFDQNNNLVFVSVDPVTRTDELFYLAPTTQRCRFTPSIEKIYD